MNCSTTIGRGRFDPMQIERKAVPPFEEIVACVPSEVWFIIFSFLPVSEKSSVSLVNKKFNLLSKQDPLWDNKTLRLWKEAIEKLQTTEWTRTKENLRELSKGTKIFTLNSEEKIPVPVNYRKLQDTQCILSENYCAWTTNETPSSLQVWDFEKNKTEIIGHPDLEPTLQHIDKFEFMFTSATRKMTYDIQSKTWCYEFSEQFSKSVCFLEGKDGLCLTVSHPLEEIRDIGIWDLQKRTRIMHTPLKLPFLGKIAWNKDYLVFEKKTKTWDSNFFTYSLVVFDIKDLVSFKSLGTLELARTDAKKIEEIQNLNLQGSILSAQLGPFDIESHLWLLSEKITEGPRFTYADATKVTFINDLVVGIIHNPLKKALASAKTTMQFFNLMELACRPGNGSLDLHSLKPFFEMQLKGFVGEIKVLKPDEIFLKNFIKFPKIGSGYLIETFQIVKITAPSRRKNKKENLESVSKRQKIQ